MTRLSIIIAAAGFLAVAAPLRAEGAVQGAEKMRSEFPKVQRPPAGMCRIWLDGVPPGQQPAPTDCATAIRHRPPKGRVVFGEPVDTPRFDRKALERNRQSQPSRERSQRMDSIGRSDRTEQGNDPRVKRRPTTRHPIIRPRPMRRDTSATSPSRALRF
jgi:hypothetical protein